MLEPGGSTVADVLRLHAVSKRYGLTQALDSVDFAVHAGEIVGLVGHNGAGKSTLMRAAIGLTRPDSGEIEVNGRPVVDFTTRTARSLGIRIVFQELSLFPTIRVFENVIITHPDLRGPGWHRRASSLIKLQLDEIFPHHRISPRDLVSDLSLAERQMVEIARATLNGRSDVSLVILDEPTSALDLEAAENLFAFMRRQQEKLGWPFVLISHRMAEILRRTDRTVVMRDGRVVAERSSQALTEAQVVTLMGGAATAAEAEHATETASEIGPAAVVPPQRSSTETEAVIRVGNLTTRRLRGVSLSARRGEIVGLAGLEGQGQRDVLLEIWHNHRRLADRTVHTRGSVAMVTGDRQTAGVFPLWALTTNVSIGALGAVSKHGVVMPKRERKLAEDWIGRLAILGRLNSMILELSGGTQQKVLLARAFASDAEILLLDDPFRGVDVETKREAYRLIHEEAANGRCFLWYSSENVEIEQCDRACVFRAGSIVAELSGADVKEENIISASFETPSAATE